ncbi:hypothetical protein CEXT_587111 [Caerostris extrusa]|uniref:Uncharacterized protein n=1 Tax=Caerostris extrusa TaxID=172846 RepID=A0AAV4RW93_CAEEX|nr:hypothetical protein CEXT_587111 [Caerostris extrusa]
MLSGGRTHGRDLQTELFRLVHPPWGKCISCHHRSPSPVLRTKNTIDRSTKRTQAGERLRHKNGPVLGLKGTEPQAAIAGLLWQLPLSAPGSEGETSGPVIVDLGVMESGATSRTARKG